MHEHRLPTLPHLFLFWRVFVRPSIPSLREVAVDLALLRDGALVDRLAVPELLRALALGAVVAVGEADGPGPVGAEVVAAGRAGGGGGADKGPLGVALAERLAVVLALGAAALGVDGHALVVLRAAGLRAAVGALGLGEGRALVRVLVRVQLEDAAVPVFLLEVVARQCRQLDATQWLVDVVAVLGVLGLLADTGGRRNGADAGRLGGRHRCQGGGDGLGLGHDGRLAHCGRTAQRGRLTGSAGHRHGLGLELGLAGGLDRGPCLGAAVLVAGRRRLAEFLDLAAPLGKTVAVQGVGDARLHIAAGDVNHAMRPCIRASLAVLKLGQRVAKLAAAEIALGGRNDNRYTRSQGGCSGADLERGQRRGRGYLNNRRRSRHSQHRGDADNGGRRRRHRSANHIAGGDGGRGSNVDNEGGGGGRGCRQGSRHAYDVSRRGRGGNVNRDAGSRRGRHGQGRRDADDLGGCRGGDDRIAGRNTRRGCW